MIFLSFAGENAELARALGLRMRAAGAEVWCSVFKDDLDDGDPWPDQIYAALDRCSVFVLLVTDAPLDGMTKEESDHARNLYNKLKRPRVVSVRLSDAVALPRRYESLQAVVLPPDWELESSNFVANKLVRWGEVAIPPAHPTAIPVAEPAAAPVSPAPAPTPIRRDEVPAAPPKPVALGVAPAQEIVASDDPPKRSSDPPPNPDHRWRNRLAVVGLLALTAWGGIKLFGDDEAPREPATARGDREATQAAERDTGADRSTPASDDPDPEPVGGELLLEMVPIPAGKFLMGGTGHADEQPQHEVTLAAFELAKTEVTRGQWIAVMSTPPEGAGWGNSTADAELPATNMTWDEANVFCAKLSEREGLKGAKRYRLPSESEWEYACRAGTTMEYWSGDTEKDLDRVGWYGRYALSRAHPVGEKPANPWGLFDMHGNVWEWCEDRWHDSYAESGRPDDGRAWTEGASPYRVIRGGSFENPAESARSASRSWYHPSNRWSNVGFRPARSVTTD